MTANPAVISFLLRGFCQRSNGKEPEGPNTEVKTLKKGANENEFEGGVVPVF
jgi:hypothetical protein